MKRLGVILAFVAMATIWLYGMFITPTPKWLTLAFQIVSYGIGAILIVGFLYWIYSLAKGRL